MIEPMITLLLGLFFILLIIAANGYFVAQEFAYMAVDRAKLATLAATGDASAKRALAVTKRTSFMLSGAQLGITVTGLVLGFVAEPLVGESMGVLLQQLGLSLESGIAIGTMATLAVAMIVQMILGELYPKNLAIANAEPMARMMSRSTLIYMSVFGWIISFFDKSANLVLRVVGIQPVHDLDMSASEDDLHHIIADSRESGDLPVELSLMMDRILDFPARDVEHAMVPRSQVDWVSPETKLSELLALMAQAHTRYPVLDDNDAPVGVVHLSDVLAKTEADSNDTVASVMRPASVLPTLMPLPNALDQLVRTTNQLACVIDEYGGFAGVLTIEDLAMEIVGEITDEHDSDHAEAVVPESDNIWLMDGDVHIDEVERVIGYDLPRGDVETIAGVLIAACGALPAVGDTVTIALPIDPSELAESQPIMRHLEVDILSIERHIPTSVRVTLIEQPIAEDNQ
ncbi:MULTISPECIES: hemolysin family protein [unclassified Salinivibrio]|uniref:hemolysin family protein n=1 Tax=unclassified Salinivibrio TaxID=2636825 RepID=UPI00128DEEC2|nr:MULTISPECIES: hemolysin family protein [unclassified Salinivibrio]MPS31900.1 HlyC/CorC family transporter [Salinivibrio sp. VYel7]MPX93294.1 HlyC/CorC family transporter [Salinivibrio sp. VYel9]MPX95879.1 HlyC/CorC family transporter [Salinivibrio sp. VYel6]MPX99512.1 HlyC/CorC family transporter [Salinivibrio sp. VYel4]MPY02639.1 HlyC/CorC family transporter [Salinivibrio sp. VYel5]